MNSDSSVILCGQDKTDKIGDGPVSYQDKRN